MSIHCCKIFSTELYYHKSLFNQENHIYIVLNIHLLYSYVYLPAQATPMDPLPTHLPETGNKDASTHPAETVTSTRDGINHALEYSSAPMPLREEFNSSRAALSQLVKPTNDKDIVLSALIQGLEILCNDGRYNDSVIISLDKLGNSDAIIDWVKKHLENFPAAPLIFCYSREHDVLLPLLKSLGNIIYYPNVRFFDYA